MIQPKAVGGLLPNSYSPWLSHRLLGSFKQRGEVYGNAYRGTLNGNDGGKLEPQNVRVRVRVPESQNSFTV